MKNKYSLLFVHAITKIHFVRQNVLRKLDERLIGIGLVNQTLTKFKFMIVTHPHESCYGVLCVNVRNVGEKKMDMEKY